MYDLEYLDVDTYDYCKECDCILRWDEAETLCKSCEERKEEG